MGGALGRSNGARGVGGGAGAGAEQEATLIDTVREAEDLEALLEGGYSGGGGAGRGGAAGGGGAGAGMEGSGRA